VLYSYRYHSRNATLLNGVRAVVLPGANGGELASFYMLGAMRLWAGNPPMLLQPLLSNKALKWTPATLMILISAVWGAISPPSLRARQHFENADCHSFIRDCLPERSQVTALVAGRLGK